MRLIQISAWNDSGGGFTHRLFDAHPQLRVWPFELLLGRDHFPVDGFDEAWFRGRFRWPRLIPDLLAGEGHAAFDALADSEMKAVLRAPQIAKHSAHALPVSLEAWRGRVAARWSQRSVRNQSAYLSLYITAFFDLLLQNEGDVRPVLGHCPIAILDAPEMWTDFPDAHIVHVVRSPFDGFADMRRRHPALDPAAYGRKWTLINSAAALWSGKRPGHVTLVSLSQISTSREATMRYLSQRLNLDFDQSLLVPSWQGRALDEADMGPFGGVFDVTRPTGEAAVGLSSHERAALTDATCGTAQLLNAISPGLQIEGSVQ